MPEVVDIDEESKKHEDEWVLFAVTEVDEDDLPIKGRLLWHSKSRDEIQEVAMEHRGASLGLMTHFVGDPVAPDKYVVL